MTLEQGMAAVITALAAAVLYLFKSQEAMRAACEQDRKECEEDRRKLWQYIYRLEGRSDDDDGRPLRRSDPNAPNPLLPNPRIAPA